MTSSRTALEAATGKLIAAMSKEGDIETGEPGPIACERDASGARLLLAASRFGSIVSAIGSGPVLRFLGAHWVKAHPRVLPYIAVLDSAQ